MEHEVIVRESKIRVLVADDTRIHTQMLADVLKRDTALQVSSAESGSAAVAATVKTRTIDVLVVSCNLDEQPGRGFSVLRELRAQRPEIRAVILMDSSKPESVLSAFRSGARGIFSKHESVDTLCKCVRSVYRGQIWANSEQMSYAVEALASQPEIRAVNANGLSLLSKREKEVVRGLAEGLTNREIAQRLGLSQHTVKNYLFRLFDKLGVSSRVELLFMTLSQENRNTSALHHLIKHTPTKKQADDATMEECQKAAEQGVPVAQLALAQLYGSRRASPKDLVNAYMWYTIAREQVFRTSKTLHNSMTADELVEAKSKAAEWLSRAPKLQSSSVEEILGLSHEPEAEGVSA